MKKAFQFYGKKPIYDFETGEIIDRFEGRLVVYGGNMGAFGHEFLTWIDEQGERNFISVNDLPVVKIREDVEILAQVDEILSRHVPEPLVLA